MNSLCHPNTSAASKPGTATLPWRQGDVPLMLAPMQGLTNRALRSLFIDWVRPDVVFTEFMRVNAAAPVKRLSAVDLKEAASEEDGVPLVVQLIGHSPEPLVTAARTAQAAGAVHINLNMGCPYGRTTSGFTGGAMLRRPADLEATIPALREAVTGTFSVKLRAGYDDPEQIFSLLPLFEAAGVDFIVLHPRTVVQEYGGRADHAVTARVVRQTRLPVIANGDIRDAVGGQRVLAETGAAGLMLGRGAIADPLLFQRLRGKAPACPTRQELGEMLRRYLAESAVRYRELFCGDTQVLGKLKAILAPMSEPDFDKTFREMRRAKTLRAFTRLIDDLE